jgi:hypothetical protein
LAELENQRIRIGGHPARVNSFANPEREKELYQERAARVGCERAAKAMSEPAELTKTPPIGEAAAFSL